MLNLLLRGTVGRSDHPWLCDLNLVVMRNSPNLSYKITEHLQLMSLKYENGLYVEA